MTHPHPSVFLAEELAVRGWTRDELATRMTPGGAMNAKAWGVNRLALDLYLEADEGGVPLGATEGMRMGVCAVMLDHAFDVAPGFFQALEDAWLAGRQDPS